MKIYNKDVNEYLISLLRHQVSIRDFEQWLYKNDVILEEILGEQLYFQLINLNYSSKFVIDELEPLLINILQYKSIQDFRIKDLLHRLVYIDKDFISTCREVYIEYCNGYSFLRMIALKYIVYDYDFQLENEKNKIEFEKDREEYVEEGKRLLEFFDSGKIEVIAEHEYIDLRTIDERIEEKYWK